MELEITCKARRHAISHESYEQIILKAVHQAHLFGNALYNVVFVYLKRKKGNSYLVHISLSSVYQKIVMDQNFNLENINILFISDLTTKQRY